ncbi:MAG: nucleotidyl transferase AbiEii/AbiGii toxin family protein [Flavobacteriales bacterium]|nr:nucleotidyl transferase AbiEii/AbiGii toxin family protein [Flavobacteriales bacterium]
MLHYETVEPDTLAVLKRLMALEALKTYSLVGGTALALRYGHRISVDIDLFTETGLDHNKVIEAISNEFGPSFTYQEDHQIKWAVFGFIDNVKLDIVRFPHARIADVIEIDGLRLYDDADIGPMKIEAILHRGQKKDFWDLLELLKAHGVQWIMDKHRLKYPKSTISISLSKAITYFVDAEKSETPVSLKGQKWDRVKQDIVRMVNGFLL